MILGGDVRSDTVECRDGDGDGDGDDDDDNMPPDSRGECRDGDNGGNDE